MVPFVLIILSFFLVYTGHSAVAEDEPAGGLNRVHDSLHREENFLIQYLEVLKKGAAGKASVADLPTAFQDPSHLVQWIQERFPQSCYYSFIAGQNIFTEMKEGGFAPYISFSLGRLEGQVKKMMAIRRQFVEPFGALGLVLGSPEKRASFRKEQDALAQQFTSEGKTEEEFLKTFIELEGPSIAHERWAVEVARQTYKRIIQHMESEGCAEIVEKINTQKKILRRPPEFRSMILEKMNFFKDAYHYFYCKNEDTFTQQVEDLWTHLGAHKKEFEGVDQGGALYKCLRAQKAHYQKSEKKLMARVLEVIKIEAELAEKIPDLDQTPEEAAEGLQSAEKNLEAAYVQAIHQWELYYQKKNEEA